MPLLTLISGSRAYAGIGSRSTPIEVLRLMEELGSTLAKVGLVLRSGGAPGADMAFERGCDCSGGKKEIFLPWEGFNKNGSPYFTPPQEAFEIAERIHPRWAACKRFAKKLHARNCQQVLGERLDDPVDFVVFWAPEKQGVVTGGTATAVHLARIKGIPTFNLLNAETRAGFISLVDLQNQRKEPLVKVCAWCGKTIEDGKYDSVSHGICRTCAGQLTTKQCPRQAE